MSKKISANEAAEMVKVALDSWDFSADTSPEDGEDTRKGLEYMRGEIPDEDLAESLNALLEASRFQRGISKEWDALGEIALNYGRELG